MNVATKANKDTSNQKVMRQFLSLPIVLGTLLTITGLIGIYVNHHSTSDLFRLNDAALGPTLAFDEITANLNLLSQNILRLNQSGVNAETETKLLKKTQTTLKKVSKQVKAQLDASAGQPYQAYLAKWNQDWIAFQTGLEPKLGSLATLKPESAKTEESITGFIEQMNNVNTFIQSDAQDILKESTLFSKRANLFLFAVLGFGLLIGSISSLIIVKSIRNLFILIAQGKKNIETLLNNLDQGFLMFGKSGQIEAGVSRAAVDFFGKDPTGTSFSDVIPFADAKSIENTKSWMEMIYQGTLRFVDFKPLAPRSFEQDNRYIELDFRPIFADDSTESAEKLDRVICIASDKTEERRLRMQAEAESSLVKMVMAVLSDKDSFVDFVLETRKNLKDLDTQLATAKPSLDALFRGMHSIKGGTAAFHLTAISREAHHLENQLADIRVKNGEGLDSSIPLLKEGTAKISTMFETFLKQNVQIFGQIGEKTDRSKIVPVQAIHQVATLIVKQIGKESEVFRDFVSHFVQEDIGSSFKRFESVVQGIAERQYKKVNMKVETGKVKVYMDPYLPLLSAYIHVFRNAMDHGIEDEVTRVENGKTDTGTITVRFEKYKASNKDMLRIFVEDDGKGIDPAIVRQKAVEKKIVSQTEATNMTDSQVIQLLFHNGFSTKEEVSDLSGRGVGTDAIKFEAEKLEGKAWIESTKGQGTKFIVEVPFIDGPTNLVEQSVETKTIRRAA